MKTKKAKRGPRSKAVSAEPDAPKTRDIISMLKPETAGKLGEFCEEHHDASPETVIDRAILSFIAHK